MRRSSEDFAKSIMERFASDSPFEPSAYYDADGDCIEMLLSDAPFKRRRIDKWVTVYQSRAGDDIVGACIKNIREMLERFPGIDIDIQGGRVRLGLMLRGPAYSTGDPVTKACYKDLILKAADLEVELQGAGR